MGPEITSGPSDRVRVARLAAEAALGTPGVLDLDSGLTGTFATVGGGTRVAGVTSAAAPDGGFDLGLRLVCELITLPPLADKVRRAVHGAVKPARLHVSSVTIDIVDVREPEAG